MTVLTPALRELRELSRKLGTDLRTHALAVDADPLDHERWRAESTLTTISLMATPAPFRDGAIPEPAATYTETTLGRTVANLELARGDAGVLNACAAPSLAGLAVDALGDAAQQEHFYRELAEHRPWTFFGMTEQQVGSDATAMTTRLAPGRDGDFRLSGAKRWVSNADRGGIGVVFARTGPTPLSVRAVLLARPATGFTSTELPMIGLRGACLGEMRFDAVRVPREHLLGAHLPASRRGMWGVNRTFNVMRLQIAAQALGVAFAIRDHVRELRPAWAGHELMSARLRAARELLYDSAVEVDERPDDRRPPSIVKLHAGTLAVATGRWAEAALPPGALLTEPLLEKWCRDVQAFEFMDGTSNIQRITIAPDPAQRRERS